MKRHFFAALSAAALVVTAVSPAWAGNIVKEWASVKAPPAPALKPVTVDPKTTALLVLDMIDPICNAKRYPRCPATVPTVKKLLTEARAAHMMVVYTGIPHVGKEAINKELAPVGNEPYVQSFLDKFLHTNLEKILKDKGITTVIDVGVAAQGAVITTSSEAAQRGFKVILPVDGMSAQIAYPEQYTAWDLANAPVISPKITLTQADMIKF
jgi:nicotinamidase-related amidase